MEVFLEFLEHMTALYIILPLIIIVTSLTITVTLVQAKYEIKHNKEYLKAILEQLKQCQIEMNYIAQQIKKDK